MRLSFAIPFLLFVALDVFCFRPSFNDVDEQHRASIGAHRNHDRTSKLVSNIRRDKPYFVIHIGPHKTATTTLQTDLTKFNETLDRDGYFYAGRYYNPFVNDQGATILNRRDSSLVTEMKRMFRKTSGCEESQSWNSSLFRCTEKFRQELEKHEARNIILSDEGLGAPALKERRHYSAIRRAIGDKWEPLIVLGYRRFFEWMPSDIYQAYRFHKRGARKDDWPHMKGSKGKRVPEIFPDVFESYRQDSACTFFLQKRVENVFPVKVLNLHRFGRSVTSSFLCDVLPDASTSCSESLELDRQGIRTVMNSANEGIHWNFDKLIVGAADLGLVDINRFGRRDFREDLVNFTHSLGLSPFDFELDCPSQEQLEDLLNVSLVFERSVLGEKEAAEMESETRAAFWQKAAEHLFCSVDANSTISKQPWKQFFDMYRPQQQ